MMIRAIEGQPADFAISAMKNAAPNNRTSETIPNMPTNSEVTSNPTVNVSFPPNLSDA